MKKFLYFLTTMLLYSYTTMAQEKLYVYEKDGVVTEFYTSNVDSIAFLQDITPYVPDEDKDEIPADLKKNLFSINPVQKVIFSPGNLQYHPAKDEWRFAPDQTAHVGKDNENISPVYYGWIDLFGWGTGNNPTQTSMVYNDYYKFVDWGENKIGDDMPNTWRSLSANEWDYLIHSRENASNLITVARVKGNNGIILLPDDWVCPEGVTLKIGFDTYNEGYSTFQVITAPVWEELEAAGAIFLPAIGYRKGVEVKELQVSCRYWTGYWHTTVSAAMFYGDASYVDIEYTYPYDGLAVRLVSTQTF